jgi:hypothetical protein
MGIVDDEAAHHCSMGSLPEELPLTKLVEICAPCRDHDGVPATWNVPGFAPVRTCKGPRLG